ncbi:MAG: DUF1932 domain-containing protein [Gammaproteobacteria bacterium]|nr:DUF1932 domain-containing protein [Gammaproteobacteria bacterium]
MGASLGAALRSNGHEVRWVAEGRSPATAQRAQDADLTATDALEDAILAVDHVLSVCPPHAAVAVAEAVMAAGFDGTYVDANAVSPDTARRIGTVVGPGFVDGGIVGPPAWRPGVTRLYLSGPGANDVAGWFAGTLVDARAVPGSASALKMCYAAFTKGSSALLLAIRALAEREGVTDALLAEWALSQPGLPERSAATAVSTSAKAWRFEGEMREIAATFGAAGLPGGFHEAAAEVFGRMSPLKDAAETDIERVVAHLLGNDQA